MHPPGLPAQPSASFSACQSQSPVVLKDMPAPKRISKMPFILVPNDHTTDNRHMIRAAQKACRVAFHMGFTPISPLLFYLTYLGPGELDMEMQRLTKQWLQRCDRIWLQFPYEEEEELDSLCFAVIEHNRNLDSYQGRRPVYMLHPISDDRIGYVPVVMTKEDVRDLLSFNLTAGVAKRCL